MNQPLAKAAEAYRAAAGALVLRAEILEKAAGSGISSETSTQHLREASRMSALLDSWDADLFAYVPGSLLETAADLAKAEGK